MGFVDLKQIPVWERLPGWRGRIYNSESMTFAYWEFDAGSSVHQHQHPNEEVWNVIEGELEVTIGDQVLRAGPGTAAIVPKGVRHGVRALSDGRALVVDYPLRSDEPPKRSGGAVAPPWQRPRHTVAPHGEVRAMRDDPVQQRITGFWSTVAPDYEARGGNVPARGSEEFDAWIEALRELLPPAPADVLDVATGTGFAALIAAGLGHRVTAIDLAEPMLNEARRAATERGLDVRFELADAVSPGLPPASLDAIVCRHLIWTLREPETAFRRWRELLRPDGRVVAIDGYWFREEPRPSAAQEPESPGLFDRHYTRETRAALPTMSFTSPEPLIAMLERAGFVNLELGYLSRVHALAKDPPGRDPWYVVTARAGRGA